MENSIESRISHNRRLLANPYAFLDDHGQLSALTPINSNPRTPDEISASRRLLQDPYAHLDDDGSFSAVQSSSARRLKGNVNRAHLNSGRYADLRTKESKSRRHSAAQIEEVAIELQRRIWRDRSDIWEGAAPSDPINILNPSLALQLLGFEYDEVETIGQYIHRGVKIEVAGTIDKMARQVQISCQFPGNIRNFTAAHELGHALLHSAPGLHRDRPMDGASLSKEPREFEADKFATFFLMPAKLIKERFTQQFGTDHFVLTEDTNFALTRSTALDHARTRLRDLTRKLAGAERYNGQARIPLATQFRVSNEAMAIRLEELDLVSI